jgi:zona occludens toxin
MIVFHEGLPRSGKSYEAMKERIVPALKERRAVVAYVEGIGSDEARQKIADLAGITLDECRQLLTALTREECARIEDHSVPNALYVLDEAQNFWPNGREKLNEKLTKFITEHGHEGQDLVLMGQDLRDVHSMWRRRCEMKFVFLKLSAIGAEGSYSVTVWRYVGKDKFEKATTTTRRYDKAFFGTYKSHVSDDRNKANYKDARASVFNTWFFKLGVPVCIVGAVWGGLNAWKFFHPAPVQSPVAQVKPQSAGAAVATAGAPAAPAPTVVKSDMRSVQERRFAELSGRSRIRLAGLISSAKRTSGFVEWVDGNTHVVERLTLDALRDLGVSIVISEGSVRLALGEWSELATAWPLEADGRVSDARLAAMRPPQERSAIAAGGAISLGGGGGPAAAPDREPVAPLSTQSRRSGV